MSISSMAQSNELSERFNPEIYGVTSLAIAPDARAGAMGDMGVATDADANSQYWNCAKYPWNIARAGVSASYTPWLRKIVTGINLANIFQVKWDAMPATCYIDNVYFYTPNGTDVDNITVQKHAVKKIENGQLIIIRDGVKYDITGSVIR